MKISIIIPTYNRVGLITRAINSIVNQTHAEWELVVVDDGSIDTTEEAIKPLLGDSRIRYYKKANSGAAHTRNVGVDYASAEWVTFLDSDDEAEPTWLEKLIAAQQKEKASVVCCGLTRYNKDGTALGSGMPLNMGKLFCDQTARFTNGGVFLLRKKVFTDIGGFDPQLRSGQHTELAIRLMPYLLEHKLTIANVFESLIKVHIHDGPRIRQNYDAIFNGSSRTLTKHEASFRKDKDNHFLYLSIAAVAAMRTKRYSDATRYFVKALTIKPLKPISWTRVVISVMPGLRDIAWRR
jgi:glycosyltransferase involved in cell wall biosynthesis